MIIRGYGFMTVILILSDEKRGPAEPQKLLFHHPTNLGLFLKTEYYYCLWEELKDHENNSEVLIFDLPISAGYLRIYSIKINHFAENL